MEFVPGTRPPGPDCTDIAAWGVPSAITPQYIAKIKVESEEDYPKEACPPYYYSSAIIDNWQVTTSMTGTLPIMNIPSCAITCTSVLASGNISAATFSATSKLFNIPHPSQEGKRLLHGCLEGPEHGVYVRGRVKGKEISLPSYWKDLVDVDSITVNLTPVGAHQNVIVKRWDEERIYLQANGGMPIDCFYHVYAERKDIDPLVVEKVDTES